MTDKFGWRGVMAYWVNDWGRITILACSIRGWNETIQRKESDITNRLNSFDVLSGRVIHLMLG